MQANREKIGCLQGFDRDAEDETPAAKAPVTVLAQVIFEGLADVLAHT